MQFPDWYFEDEVRDGFYVYGMMKRAWAAQLEVLEDIDKVCKKHNIAWFVDCGSLLGCIRHGGFIPWDDDLDICMTRDNYTRFNQIAQKELPEGYALLNMYTDDEYNDMMSRVTNGREISVNEKHLEKYHGFPYAAGVDIFPLDYIAPNEDEEKQRKEIARVIFNVKDMVTKENEKDEEVVRLLSDIESVCNIKFNKDKPIAKQLNILLDGLFSLYGPEESKELALMPYWIQHDDHKYPKEFFATTVLMPYEITKVPVPIAYEGALRIEYGENYMQPSQRGGVHDYPYYGVQENILVQHLGKVPFAYELSMNDMNVKSERDVSPKEQITNIIQLMRQANGEIRKAISCNVQEAMELLEACQDSAIRVGNLLEGIKGEGFVTVGLLEQYCEMVYCIHEKLSAGSDGDIEIKVLDLGEQVEKINESFKENVLERKEIVFITHKASKWDYIESVWKSACADEAVDVYVIPIPYYYKNYDGSFKNACYEGDKYPEYVTITDYNTYDLKTRHPDKIYIQDPYDEINYTTSVNPFFYSKNIWNMTEELIYIPCFVLDEIRPDDEKAILSMKHFVTVPGVVNADKVIVQSENMKKAYVNYLTEHAGEDTRDIWENKILGLGSPITDKVASKEIKDYNIPNEWLKVIEKTDGSRKKIILYNTSAAALAEHKEKMLDKIKDVLKIFKENEDDIALIWRSHPLLSTVLGENNPELLKSYNLIVEEYRNGNWGIYDDTAKPDMAVDLCDGYYGDSSAVVQLCKKAGKPVMIQSVDVLTNI